MVHAEHGEAVEGDILDEILEGAFEAFEIPVVVEVLGVDIGDNGHGGAEPQEAAIALVGLHHDPVALAHLRIGAIGVDDAAIDYGGIEAPRVEHRGDHGGRGRLAVGARHGDGEGKAHELRQHLGAADEGNAKRAAGGHFGIIGLDGAGIDDGRGALHMGGGVADEDAGAQARQALGVGARLSV